MNIEDKIVLLKETISNLNTQYGNKLGYRGPSHYISLHIMQKEVNLDWTGHKVVILEITYHVGHKTIYFQLAYRKTLVENDAYYNLLMSNNESFEGYANSEEEIGSEHFYEFEESIKFIESKLIYIFEKYPKNK